MLTGQREGARLNLCRVNRDESPLAIILLSNNLGDDEPIGDLGIPLAGPIDQLACQDTDVTKDADGWITRIDSAPSARLACDVTGLIVDATIGVDLNGVRRE